MLMVSVYAASREGDRGGTEVGDVAGADGSLGLLAIADGLADASGSGLLVQPLSNRPRATVPPIIALLAGMLVSLSLKLSGRSWHHPRTHFAAFSSCHDPSILYEGRLDWVPVMGCRDGIARLARRIVVFGGSTVIAPGIRTNREAPMPQRLTPLEVALLALDTAHTPGHVGTLHIFDPGPEGFDYERLIALIRERLAFVPRYR